jgi:hypothetical protein
LSVSCRWPPERITTPEAGDRWEAIREVLKAWRQTPLRHQGPGATATENFYIVVKPCVDGGALYELIAGQRRLEAVKQLGWTEVAVHVVDLDEIVRGEFAENQFRKDLTRTEQVAIAEALKPLLEAEARKRKDAGPKVGRSWSRSELSRGRRGRAPR